MPAPNPFADEPLPENILRPISAGNLLNPYAAPSGEREYLAEFDPGVGVWRNGDLVIIHQSLDFPDRCILTNDPGVKRRTLALVYAELLARTRSKIRFAYSLSKVSWQRRLRAFTIPSGTLPLGIILWYCGLRFAGWSLGPETISFWVIASGVLTTIGSLLVLWWNWQIMSLVSRDGPYFAIRGAGEPFLNSLPEWIGNPMPRR